MRQVHQCEGLSLKADDFLKAALEYIEPLKESYLYEPLKREFLGKTGRVDAGYAQWLGHLIPYLVEHYHLNGPLNILDFGCGFGELTVMMNAHGFRAVGIDINERHLRLAEVLARENGLPKETFVLSRDRRLPFADKTFSTIVLLVVLEHLENSTLSWLLPELRRVNAGVIFVLAPNKLQLLDDHTGLRLVPWMPRWLAASYVRLRGQRYRYLISEDGSWDVSYRTLGQIARQFRNHGFRIDLVPDALVYPPLCQVKPLNEAWRAWARDPRSNLLARPVYYAVSGFLEILTRCGYPRQGLYPYLNLVAVPLVS